MSTGGQPVKVEQPEFEDALSRVQLPDLGTGVMPFPLPVEDPVLNPDSAGQPQPLRVPQGDPVPVPNTDPQQYKQPVTKIVPASTSSDPWRVDVQAETVTSTNPNPLEDSASSSESTQDFCAQNPSVLACQALDTPDDTDLPTEERQISVTPDSGWGAESASCPAPRQIVTQGRTIPIPFDLFCMYMEGLRPVIIAMAWLGAAFIIVGAREGS
ncbi:MAG: hypothetical protein E5299_02543 [Burkholderia gladioli]|nr:MAG: hypothetical protein E5299_02543 [Burkholderia gladioli]